jgi:hypothetical protein
MELDVEIFDKDGKALHIGSVISRYLFKLAEKHDKNVEDIILGLELIYPITGENKLQLTDDDFNLIDEIITPNGL